MPVGHPAVAIRRQKNNPLHLDTWNHHVSPDGEECSLAVRYASQRNTDSRGAGAPVDPVIGDENHAALPDNYPAVTAIREIPKGVIGFGRIRPSPLQTVFRIKD